jgi:hypothetical protein
MHAQGAKWPKCGVLHRFSGLFADVGRNSGAPDRWFFAEMTKFAWCVCAGLPVFMPDIALQNKIRSVQGACGISAWQMPVSDGKSLWQRHFRLCRSAICPRFTSPEWRKNPAGIC